MNATLTGRARKRSQSRTGVALSPQRGLTMGILDALENSPAFKSVLGQLEAAVIPVVLSEVLGNGSQGGLIGHCRQAAAGGPWRSGQILDRERSEPADHGRAIAAGARQRHGQAIGGAGSTSRSINSARCWRNMCRPRWTMPARTASSLIPSRGPEAVSGLARPDSSAVAGRAFIALKNLQNPCICYVPM